MAQATSAADDMAGEGDPDPTHPYVEALTGLPGVEHVAVVDVSGQHVLGEWGGPAGSADPLLARARAAADRTGRRELEDVVSTTPSAFHLSRLVLAGPGHPESVWVALRVDRSQGSLPWSRAALAGLDGPTGAPVLRPRIPAPRDPDGPDVAGPSVPAPRIVPPPPAPVLAPARVVSPPVAPPMPVAMPVAPAPRVHVALTARVATPAPAVAAGPVPDTAETAVASVAEVAVAQVVEVAEVAQVVEVAEVAEVAETVEIGLPRPVAPVAGVEAPAPEPTRRSSFAPVMVVLPPPSPVPEDGSTEEPAPMPYPVIIAPDPVDRAVAEDVPDAEVTPDATEPTDDAPAESDEPRVMRRLIHGLRRRP
ncbi:hypothetical protein [Actinomycetospora chiangmaiensis]|uniref:hypothetical protein n=1 Tax=Actinomycetospora chiangmaiensis TaxID=402650 RepID=UPI0012FBA21B|nr:hypothetical protein [Actinomycetospora chiangmaiensis]